jgi:hypothetical protein
MRIICPVTKAECRNIRCATEGTCEFNMTSEPREPVDDPGPVVQLHADRETLVELFTESEQTMVNTLRAMIANPPGAMDIQRLAEATRMFTEAYDLVRKAFGK